MEEVTTNNGKVTGYVGTCYTRKAKAIQDALRQLGPKATYAALRAAMPAGVGCSRPTFYEHYRKLFGPKSMQAKQIKEEDSVVTAVRVDPPEDDEEDEVDDDIYCPKVDSKDNTSNLSLFMRFALVVEAVGGIDKATELLGELRRLGKIFKE